MVLSIAFGLFAVPGVAAATRGTQVSSNGSTSKKVPVPRTVEGAVHSNSGGSVEGAVVYLKDTRSLAVKSYLSGPDGRFHFRQLSLNADYDLWAERNGKRSRMKHISQFNSKPDLHYTLNVNTGK
jgi:hypothetical protein